MRSKLFVTNALTLITLVAAACGSAAPSASVSPSPSPAPTPSASPSASPSPVATGTTIAVATNARLGKVLVDGKGKTVYLFVADKGKASTCYSSCATYWPPVLTTGTPQAGTGAKQSLLGTTRRSDGKVEVTYAGHPLYYFLQDKKAGDTTGQGVNGFGALWWVMNPSGAAIKM
jgi:predicted lipoprotein with Yx(FWY)xxD motif